MNKIKVFSLGGLNENGKNLYVVEINGRILLFDAGLKYANEKMLGVDYVIPDFSYLIENKKRIVGLFISHAHYENMGAVTDLLKVIPDLHIFATNYTSKIIEIEALESEVKVKNMHIIKPHRKIDFKEFSVFPFSVSHSVPESVGFSINTPNGAIVYMTDFVIDSTMKDKYDMDLGKLAYIGKQGVLLLMNESVFSEKQGFTSPNHKLDKYFKDAVEKSEGRIIFSILSLHLLTIQNIFDAIKGTNRKVVIMGKYLQTVIDMAIKEGYLHVLPGVIGDLRNLKDSDSVILVNNDRETPYYNLSRIVNGYDKYVTLESTDSICFADPSYEAQELTSVRIKNDIAMHGVKIYDVPKSKSVRLHASSQDLMLMVKIFKENILLKENGDIVTFIDGELSNDFKHIQVDDVLIDGKSTNDVGELVLKDREMLGKNGLIVISATVDKKTKNIKNGPEILSRGVIFDKDNNNLIDEIKKRSLEIIKNNVNGKYADYAKIRTDVREDVGNYLYKLTESKPVILTVIQEV